MRDRIIDPGRRAVAAGSARHQSEPARDFLRSRNRNVSDLPVLLADITAFVEGVLAGDLVPVLVNHEVNAVLRSAFFSGLGKQDDVAVERNRETMQQEKN